MIYHGMIEHNGKFDFIANPNFDPDTIFQKFKREYRSDIFTWNDMSIWIGEHFYEKNTSSVETARECIKLWCVLELISTPDGYRYIVL